MSTVADLQGKINSQADKLSQLEADVKDLVAKAGGTAPPPASGLSITQDQVDSMSNAIDSANARIDALKDEVVNGPPPPSTSSAPVTGSGTSSSTPASSSPPADTPPTVTPAGPTTSASTGTPEPMPSPPTTPLTS